MIALRWCLAAARIAVTRDVWRGSQWHSIDQSKNKIWPLASDVARFDDALRQQMSFKRGHETGKPAPADAESMKSFERKRLAAEEEEEEERRFDGGSLFVWDGRSYGGAASGRPGKSKWGWEKL